MSDIIFILIVTYTILHILSTQSIYVMVNLYLPSLYSTFDPGLTVTVNFIFTLREPNVYKPHVFFLGFLATFICFCVTVLFYRYLYFVVNQIKLQSYKSYKVTNDWIVRLPLAFTVFSSMSISAITSSIKSHGDFPTL